MKPKIAFFVIDHASVGGVEMVTSKLISLFISKSLNIHSLISLGDQKKTNPIINYHNSIVINCIEKKNISTHLPLFLKEKNITHLIFQGDNMTIAKNILIATKDIDCKALLHYHGSPFAYLKKSLYWYDFKENPINILKIGIARMVYPFKKRKLLRNIKQSVDGFITVSNGSKNEINTIFNTTFNQVLCIHNPTSFKPINETTSVNKEKKVILISRLVRKHKNVLLALRVWKHLYLKYPDWELQILGDGVKLPKLKNYIAENNLQNVNLVGLVDNVDDYLVKSAITISTSDTEGFPMTIYESLVFKNPIVTTRSYGGIYDMVIENENGLFSPKDHDKKMASNLEILMSNDKLRTEMGADSFNKFLKLQQEDIFKQWMDILKINRKDT